MRSLSLAFGLALLGAGPTLAAPLINGSFEQPGVPGAHFLSPGSTYMPGWTTIDATPGGDSDITLQDNAAYGALGVVASQGDFLLDLTGIVGRGKGVISDAVALTPGGAYRLAFDVGAFYVRNAGSYGDATVDLLINNVLVGSFTNTMDLAQPGSDWLRFSYDFIAGGPSARFTFLSSTSTASSYLGVGLDNVTLDARAAAVPEPAAWALMILGFGLAGVALRRRAGLRAA